MRPASILGTANLLIVQSVHAASCYTVNGEEYTDSSFVPCNPNAETSPCCASNKGTRSDICMSSGLCYSQDGDNRGLIYMNGCTDDTGLSTDCPHICPDGMCSFTPMSVSLTLSQLNPFLATTNWGGGSAVASWNVLQCEKGTFCCREASDTANCCSNSTAIISTDIGTLLLSTPTVTSTVGTAAAATVTLTVTPEASAGQSSNGTTIVPACPADRTAVVGGAVGGALGAALLASLAALAFMSRRQRRSEPSHPMANAYPRHGPGFLEQYSKPVQNLDGSFVPPQELSAAGNAPRHELR